MTNSIGSHYLESVLGWKNIPQPLSWPGHGPESTVEVTHKYLFGVYANSQTPEDCELLKKMMMAVGVDDYQLVSKPEEFPSFIHILSFGDDPMNQSASNVKIWNFEKLVSYRIGAPIEVNARKRRAWELLQTFKKEVL